ncbi:MAG: hypothetical protein ABIF77_14965 [bacterium]
MKLHCIPEDSPLSDLLLPLATAAAERLGLARYLTELLLCLDDLDADERAWFSFGPGQRAGDGSAAEPGLRRLTIYLHPSQMLKDRPATPLLMPQAAIWEMEAMTPTAAPVPVGDFSRPKLERFLFHQFLSVRDLCDGTIDPAIIPARQADAFQEIWSITIDGRLRQERLPGFSAAERKRRFSRVFAACSVLLPEHWQIFHDLWETTAVQQEELFRFLSRLPAVHRLR